MTLEDILIFVNAYTDLEATTPTSTELTTRTNYANQAVRDAASAFNFPQFKVQYDVYASGATIAMPSNFRELDGFPKLYVSGFLEDLSVINPNEISSTNRDKYAYLLGNPSGGYNLITSGVSGATVTILYQKYPVGFATLTDVCELPDPEYVKEKVISYVLQSRNDDRFMVVERDAQTRLANMIGRESYLHGGINQVPVATQFVIGE